MRPVRAAALLFWALSAAGAAGAQTWSVEAEVRPRQVAVGETVQVCVTVRTSLTERPRVIVQEPEWGGGLVAAALGHESLAPGPGGYHYTWCWPAVADRPGTLTLPPVRVVLQRAGAALEESKTTEPLTLTVTPGGEAANLVGGRTPFQWWVLGGLGLTLVISAVAAVAWVRQGDEASEAPPADTPEARVVAGLARAERERARGDLDGAFATVAAVLRAYAGGGEAVSTTAEARERLARLPLAPERRSAIDQGLTLADQVRFAREPLSADDARAALERLRAAFIEEGGGAAAP